MSRLDIEAAMLREVDRDELLDIIRQMTSAMEVLVKAQRAMPSTTLTAFFLNNAADALLARARAALSRTTKER